MSRVNRQPHDVAIIAARIPLLASIYDKAATPPNGLNQGPLREWERENVDCLPSLGGADHEIHPDADLARFVRDTTAGKVELVGEDLLTDAELAATR